MESTLINETPSQNKDNSNQILDINNENTSVLKEVKIPEQSNTNEYFKKLEQITIQADCFNPKYVRSSYSHWSQADRYADNYKNVREKVLADERKQDGSWYSYFDNKIINSKSELDIDHFIPLAEAHRSGACNWDKQRKKNFANWTDNDYTLIAVSSSSNRSKSDRDPSKWMPSNIDYHCIYLSTWIQIKIDWDLNMDQVEYNSVKNKVKNC